MNTTRKAHVKEEEWRTGGFQVERHVRCRCGWQATHYNRGHLNELFREHARESVAVAGEAHTQ